MNSVDKFLKPAFVIECGHCPGAEVIWMDTTPGQPPQLLFRNLPNTGRMVLSKDTVVLACQGCFKEIDVILAEYGKTVLF